MAEYWEDWSGYTIGDDPTVDGPAGWTRRWHATEAVTVVDISSDSPPTGFSRALRLDFAVSNRRGYSLDAVDSDGDRATVKIAALCRCAVSPTASTTYGGVIGRGSGTTTSETGINGAFTGDSNGDDSLIIGQYSSATFTADTKQLTSDMWSINTWYWLVLELNGTTATVTLYPENDPGGTAIDSHTSTVSVTGAGWAGLFAFAGGTDVDVAAVNIATGATELSYADPSGDVTAPTLTSPTGTQTGSTTASGTVSTDEGNGTLDAVVTTSATTPSAAQIQAGQDHTGAAAAATDLNNTVSATGVQNVSFTGLTAATTYYVHYVHEDAAANVSTAVTSASFTTAAASVKGIQLSLKQADGTTAAASLTGLYYHVWDALNPGGASDANGSTETTDGSGVLEININSFSASIGGEVFLFLYDLDGTEDKDSVCFAGRVPVADIS